jgi:DNA-binding NtrC family response regulator
MSKRILVVDEDPDIRQILLDRLHSYGYSVELAVDRSEALAAMQYDGFDGILFDIDRPEIQDIAVVCQIRATHPTMPIVIITAMPDLERIIRVVIGDGPQVYLLKPFGAAQLKKIVERWFGLVVSDEAGRERI